MTAPMPDQNRMVQHLAPGAPRPGQVTGSGPGPVTASGSIANLVPPPWKIVIPASDGTELLVLREENGLLVVEGDESRWSESAKKFLFGMMQWAGGAGIRWKDEVRKSGGPA